MIKKEVKNIRDLANILGLSITTVSRVLNGKAKSYRISSETEQRVLLAVKKYNYMPNKLARGLKMEKTETLGLIIPDIANPFFSYISKSIASEARIKGYSLILCDSEENQSIENELINLLISHQVDGIIIAPVGTNFEHLNQVHQSGVNLVVVDRYSPDFMLPYITSDNCQGGLDAVNYLISMGHTKIACIQGIPDSQPNRERVNGYIRAHEINHIPLDRDYILGESFSVENGYKQTMILYSEDDPPTAIFALSNQISLGVLMAINEMGLNIPHDVSLISYDEQPYSAHLGTPLTTIEQKKKEMGQLAVNYLVKNIDNKELKNKPFNIKLKTSLIIRSSVKQFAEVV